MARLQYLVSAALVLSSAFVAPGLAARQLKQNGGTIVFPGCSFLQDSEIAKNQDYSDLYALLQATGLFDTLSNLQSPATLFAPTNQGFEEFFAAANTTLAGALADPSDVTDVLLYHLVPQAILATSDFVDGSVLPTALTNATLTISTEFSNGTETVFVTGYASEVQVVTPAAAACNLVIYGVNGVLVPEEAVDFSDSEFLQYLEITLEPGSAEVPAGLVIAAVQSGDLESVADVFDNAITAGYTQQLVALILQAATTPEGLQAMAAVGNELIQTTNCDRISPVIREAAPQLQGIDTSSLNDVGNQYPDLRSCVFTAISS